MTVTVKELKEILNKYSDNYKVFLINPSNGQVRCFNEDDVFSTHVDDSVQYCNDWEYYTDELIEEYNLDVNAVGIDWI